MLYDTPQQSMRVTMQMCSARSLSEPSTAMHRSIPILLNQSLLPAAACVSINSCCIRSSTRAGMALLLSELLGVYITGLPMGCSAMMHW